MKRTETYTHHHRKRQKIDFGENKTTYIADSARLLTEWDDDLSGDALEEVCVIAELTQAPRVTVNPQLLTIHNDDGHLAAENKRLREELKTKEGEVGILRSQLKQNQNAKQSDAINNLRNIEKLEEKHKANLELTKKQFEHLQSELEFKDLEVKSLIEKCKQLEVKSPRVNFVNPNTLAVDEKKNLFSLSQAISLKTRTLPKAEGEFEDLLIPLKKRKTIEIGEGDRLKDILDPSFFIYRNEPSVIPMYTTNASYRESLDHAKSDKYKWIGLPKHNPRLNLLHPIIIELFQAETFSTSQLNRVRDISREILQSLVDLLEFLNKLPMSIEHDKALLEDTNPGQNWDLTNILSDQLLRTEEKGVEGRRAIGVICCIARSSGNGLKTFATEEFFSLLHKITVLIGKILRPIEFCGVCVGINLFLQIILEGTSKDNMDKKLLDIARSILGEIILSRPKLDVMREVVSTLAAGAHHKDLAPKMCKASPADTSALYMDSRLQQALFFTRDACPLKLLQVQTKNLAHLCNSPSALKSIVHAFTSWLHSLISQSYKPQLWLFPSNEQCCNVLECFCYILTLSVYCAERDPQFRVIFEKGIVTLKDCCKGHKKKLKQSTLKLLPSTLRGSSVIDLMSPTARDAAFYVISEYETDVVTQETVAGLTLNCSDS